MTYITASTSPWACTAYSWHQKSRATAREFRTVLLQAIVTLDYAPQPCMDPSHKKPYGRGCEKPSSTAWFHMAQHTTVSIVILQCECMNFKLLNLMVCHSSCTPVHTSCTLRAVIIITRFTDNFFWKCYEVWNNCWAKNVTKKFYSVWLVLCHIHMVE